MLFLKWHTKRAKRKMNACADTIKELEHDSYPEAYNEAITEARLKLYIELKDLTWKYISLCQKAPRHNPTATMIEQHPEHQDTIGDLVDKIGPIAIRENQKIIDLLNLSEESIEVLKRVNSEREETESLMDRLLGEPKSNMTPELISRIRIAFDLPIGGVEADDSAEYHSFPLNPYPDSPTISNQWVPEEKHASDMKSVCNAIEKLKGRIIVLEKGLEGETPERITLKDLEPLMKGKMVEEDPGLQGDLTMLLHKLRDPANHPVSLLELARWVTDGQPEAKLVASALDMLVDEYRERIGPVLDFEMSDKACLKALDVERNTTC